MRSESKLTVADQSREVADRSKNKVACSTLNHSTWWIQEVENELQCSISVVFSSWKDTAHLRILRQVRDAVDMVGS